MPVLKVLRFLEEAWTERTGMGVSILVLFLITKSAITDSWDLVPPLPHLLDHELSTEP